MPGFDDRWPGVQAEVNAMVASMVERKADPRGIGLALMMAGSEVLATGDNPAIALAAVESLRLVLREQFPADAERSDLLRAQPGTFTN